jgi:CheY-like chemotaxis protein
MKRILIVDDNPEVRRALSKTLLKAGYEVVTAEDGADAVKTYRQQPVDLVITDLIMPNQEGLETIMQLRQLTPHLKIIAISGGGRLGPEDYLPIAEGIGAALTLAKPFLAEEMLAAVARLLKES